MGGEREEGETSSSSAIGLGAHLQASMRIDPVVGSSTSLPISSSNIGFQLLKKHGWREGTGLGISEQGRLEPIQAYVKKNKRGLGADRLKKKIQDSEDSKVSSDAKDLKDKKNIKIEKKSKCKSKMLRKILEHEKRLQEKEFERAFFREFWPDNV